VLRRLASTCSSRCLRAGGTGNRLRVLASSPQEGAGFLGFVGGDLGSEGCQRRGWFLLFWFFGSLAAVDEFWKHLRVLARIFRIAAVLLSLLMLPLLLALPPLLPLPLPLPWPLSSSLVLLPAVWPLLRSCAVESADDSDGSEEEEDSDMLSLALDLASGW
jgi:hypothetical protein